MNKEIEKSELKSSKLTKKPAIKKKSRTNILSHVDLTVEAFLGETSMTVNELNQLDEDSVIPLDVPLNKNVELRLNGVVIATGELVAVDEKFGVKITTIAKE